jgi:farnesyl-diphosphate farnesyltransferase
MLGYTPMRAATSSLLSGLLKDVSRSFYLTLRVLPGTIRPQIGLAYLLARAADTIADTELVPVSQRLQTLDALRQRILGQSTRPLDRHALIRGQPGSSRPGNLAQTKADRPQKRPLTHGESVLLERIEEVLSLLQSFAPEDQERIRQVLAIITSGQELDLNRFGKAGADRLVALQTESELDDYTYRVAGCVGEFWTHICRAHLFPLAPIDETVLVTQGVRFGKGLQLVNILRDVAADLRLGRCYLPQQQLAAQGLVPLDLLVPANEDRVRPVYQAWLDHARAHLTVGWQYTCTLPRRCLRIRLACAWPLLIGLKTLNRLAQEPVLNPERRVKITRTEVRRILRRSILLLPWPAAWERQFERIERRPNKSQGTTGCAV